MWINGAIFEVDVATQVRVAVRVEQKITNSKSPKGGCGENWSNQQRNLYPLIAN